MAPPSSVIFLAGAPYAAALDWSESALTVDLASPTSRFLAIDQEFPSISSTQVRSNWRAVPLNDRTFYETPHGNRTQHRKLESKEIQDDDFLAHSYAVHADTQLSQLAPQMLEDEAEEETTFLSTVMEDSTIFLSDQSLLDVTDLPTSSLRRTHTHQFSGATVNINAIPNASYLESLQPQTMTVNLLAGVISIAPTRTVKVRRGNYDMDIIEMTLGDETKAGFTLSSWHAPPASQQGIDPLRETLLSLRPQDIVFVERVALTSFRGQVFGQSLNRRVAKNATKLTVVCRADSIRTAVSNIGGGQGMFSLSVAAKLQRVKDWTLSFIGPAKKRRAGRHGLDSPYAGRKRQRDRDNGDEHLPPDSC